MYFASNAWDRFAESPWRKALELGLAPISIGLMLSGTYAVGHAAIVGLMPALIGATVAALILWTEIKPPYLMALGAVAGYSLLG